ncbi:MAG: peptide chain release factor N(5)-glutamine methyltransferase [Ilumatobacteraceae bacterium]
MPVTNGSEVSWRQLLGNVEAQLKDANEARWICEHASGYDRDEFLAILDDHVTVAMATNVQRMLARRLGGEPLQYVMRRWSFRHLDVMVDERVLIPRPETEQVVEVALRLARQKRPSKSDPLNIVDLGTGSGVIGLSMASELPLGSVAIWLTDISENAIHVARANLAGIGRAAEHVRVVQGSWFDALPVSLRGGIDLTVCNPPYIADGDEQVAQDVNKYEPQVALYSGLDGLDALRQIVSGASQWLAVGGWLVTEIGYEQGNPVSELLDRAGFADIEIIKDLAGRPRIACGQRKI